MSENIVIIGAGSWGTALGISFAGASKRVTLVGRREITPPTGIAATTDIAILREATIALLVTPAQATREMLPQLRPHLSPTTPLILCSKGLELSTGLRQSELVQALLPQQKFGVLSGPNFAHEVAAGLPAATVIAAPLLADAETYAAQLASPTLRPYAQDDVLGVELAGALKNVLAIGAGMVIGAGLGENARAALITRGLAEITRLGVALGAKVATFAGLAGIGDTMLTCGSASSRNFAYGHAIGSGATPDTSKTVEGLPTTRAVHLLAQEKRVDMPITEALYRLLYEHAALPDVLKQLFARPLKQES